MRKPKWLMLVAMLSALSLVAAACGGGDDGDEDGGDAAGGDQQTCEWVIGTMGALSGDAASLGRPIAQGVEFAVNQANEDGELPCKLKYMEEDSQGDPTQAPALAEKLAGTENLVFCACPYFSGETLATGDIFGAAGIAISGTGTNETIDEQGYPTWHRAVAPDNIQAEVAAAYIESGLKAQTTAVVHDNQDYSKGLADAVKENLGDAAEGPFIINPEETDFSSVVEQVAQVDPDVVFYGGYTPEAGPLLKQLREAGVDATFLSDDGSKDPTFGGLAGAANAEGAFVTCPCADPLKIDAAQEFVDGMQEEFGKNAPGTFAADVYDVTAMVIEGLKDYEGDPEDITAVREYVVGIFDEANYEGVAKTYSWEESGEFVGGPEDIWIYEGSNEDENFVSVGPASELIE